MPEQGGGIRIPVARTLGVVGVILAIAGAYYISVAFAAAAILLGTLGYAIGARNLGRAALILGVASIFVGLLLGQRGMPGSYYQKSPHGFVRDVPTMPEKTDQ